MWDWAFWRTHYFVTQRTQAAGTLLILLFSLFFFLSVPPPFTVPLPFSTPPLPPLLPVFATTVHSYHPQSKSLSFASLSAVLIQLAISLMRNSSNSFWAFNKILVYQFGWVVLFVIVLFLKFLSFELCRHREQYSETSPLHWGYFYFYFIIRSNSYLDTSPCHNPLN